MQFRRTLIASAVLALATQLAACGGGGGSSATPTPAPTPTPTNAAPTNITVDNSSVDENTPNAIVGNLTVEDADSGDTHTLEVAGTDFVINGTALQLADGVILDFEAQLIDGLTADVTATDAAGESVTVTLNISINDLMDRYTFDSKIIEGESSVSYSGQIARHTLIAELNNYINSGLLADLDDGTITTRQGVIDTLNTLFRTSELDYPDLPITFLAGTEQLLISEISGSHKDLVGKLAGNDTGGQHKDWNNGAFAGWGETGSITPEQLVDELFSQLADNAEDHLNGIVRQDINGEDITNVYVNSNGVDLKQLIQKFLLMAIPYSQGTDDYFGDDTDGKGLRTSNVGAQSEGTNYTTLEHQYDEGFGYFGAAVNYLEYTDNEIAGSVATEADGRLDWNGYQDTDGNGSIDLKSEYNWGQSVNAAKRDRGTASNSNPTDYTKQAMEAFIAGRNLINENVGAELVDEQGTQLRQYVEAGVDAWERAIVATVIHYINDTNADLAALGTEDFSYSDLAKHFSEMKGFALGIQFNERSQLSDADFEMVHTLMGNAPVLSGENEIAAYQQALLDARDILQAAYGFDAENVENW